MGFGDNFDGRLGLGNNTPQLRPVTVPGLTNVAGAEGGSQHTVVLLNDGTVVSSGLNNCVELRHAASPGRNTVAAAPGWTNVTSIHAVPYTSVALRGDGTVWAWGFN